MAARDRTHLRSLICVAGHELRITARCLREDLGDSPGALFADLYRRHGIVKAFRRERSGATAGPDPLGPGGGARPLTVLRHTHHWRGVTWFEDAEGVVWLCACGWHRSREPGDAFDVFEQMRRDGRIWPTEEDYEALAADRGEQFAALVVDDGPRLLAMARANRETEQVLVIGREPVSIVVHVVETLEETFVAVSGVTISPSQLQLLLVSLYPDRRFEEWRLEDRLPTRELDLIRAEFCVSIVHG